MIAPAKSRLLNILLADDGSLNARVAAQLITDLPHAQECHITALRVFTPLQGAEYAEVEASVEKTMNYLRSRHLHSHSETILGYPTEKIIEYADAHHPDLIVMGAKGHSMIEGLLGSVAMNVIHVGRWPVLIVREPYQGLRRILLATDGTPCSELACNYLSVFPLPARAEVEVLHIIPHDSVELGYLVEPGGMAMINLSVEAQNQARARAEARARELLTSAAQALAEQGVTASTALAWGDPENQIVNYAKEKQVDLIVCGSRGMGAMTSLLLGSVSRQVVNHAACSVLVVRCQQQDQA